MSMNVGVIVAINKIVGDSRFETAMIGNLPCVVKAGMFRVQELVMVFPVDTFVFVNGNDTILQNTVHNNVQEDSGARGVHVKPIMVHGQVSAGLIVKLFRFPSVYAKVHKVASQNKDQKGGTNTHEAIEFERPQSRQSLGFGVKTWKPSDPKTFLGERPAFVPTTTVPFLDQAPNIFCDRANWPSIWQATPTMRNRLPMYVYVVQNDSVWATALERRPAAGRGILPHARMGVCGETCDFRDDGQNTIWESLTRMEVPIKLGRLRKANLAIEGVIWVTKTAPTPQGPRPHHQFIIFAVWDIDQQKRFTLKKTRGFAKWLGLKMVTDLGQYGLSEIVLGEVVCADQGVVYMSMDGQTVMASRATQDAPKLERSNIFSPW
ncbi:hypothetical protein PG999_011146 [Apiospora kogelbergensis]|uniref:Uncharacterized protein n=1 Tax=Apiospora kogelbergensis TaxID=1337665 RepID=A0AAW0QDG6_9PEZI